MGAEAAAAAAAAGCSDGQLDSVLVEQALVWGKSLLDGDGDKLEGLLGCPTDEGGRVQQGVEVVPDGLEVLGALDAVDQVVVATLLLDDGARLVRQDADLLVAVLSGTALLDHGHDDVLGGHEGQLAHDSALDDLRVDDKAVGDVDEGAEQDVCGEEGLGDGDSADGGVVQRALEPLDRRGLERVLEKTAQVSGQGAHPLASHGVALVGHGAGPDLRLLEGLLHLLQVRQEPDVGGHLVARGAEGRERVQRVDVDLTRVRLPRARVRVLEAKQLDHTVVQRLHLRVVPVEQRQERRLRAGRALHATQAQVVSGPLEVSQVPEQLLQPQRRSLAHRRQLCRLEVRPPEHRQVLVLQRKLRQPVDHVHQLGNQDVVRVSEEDQVRVVRHETRRGPQVDDPGSLRTRFSKHVHVRHHVVSHLRLLHLRSLDLLVCDDQMLLHLRNRLVGDHTESQLFLRNRQVVPELSPRREPVTDREYVRHLLRRIT